MLGSSFPSSRFLPPHDNPFLLLESVADTLSSSDITFGNLEGSFLNNGEAVKKCKDTTICYLFRMPEKYVSALTASGFDILSLANNHFGDFGLPARKRTKANTRFSWNKLCRTDRTSMVNIQKRIQLCTDSVPLLQMQEQ